MAVLQTVLPKIKSFSRLGIRVNGMQKRQSIRSLTAKDSRNVLVTVLICLFLISTVMTRMFPKTLSRNIKQYSRIRIIWCKSENSHREKSGMNYTDHRLLYDSFFNQQVNPFKSLPGFSLAEVYAFIPISWSSEILKCILIYLNCITLR